MSSTVEERVKKIVVEQLGVKEEDVSNEASFVDDLGADSLDTVELVMALEEEFGCDIPDEEAEKITTVQQAIEYVDSMNEFSAHLAFYVLWNAIGKDYVLIPKEIVEGLDE